MVKYITFGKYNKNYKFVILTCVFKIVDECLTRFLIGIFLYKKIISEKAFLFFNTYNIRIFFFLVCF